MSSLPLICAECGSSSSSFDANGFCEKCSSPNGVTVTPPRTSSLLDAAKFLDDTLAGELDGRPTPSLCVLIAWAVLKDAIADEKIRKGEYQ